MQVRPEPLGPTLETMLLLILDRLDSNSDGLITRKELKVARSKIALPSVAAGDKR